jgi:hypothetical protein
MTARNFSTIIALGCVAVGWGYRVYAEGDVTVVTPPPSTPAQQVATVAPDGSPVVHKAFHKAKKKSAPAVASSMTTGGVTGAPATVATAPASAPKVAVKPAPVTPKSESMMVAETDPPSPGMASNTPDNVPTSLVPTVETELPVARHATTDDSVYSPPSDSYRQTIASSLSPLQPQSPPPPNYQPGNGSPYDNYNDNPLGGTKKTRTYPWKRDIITTEFWIGEPGSVISPTDNVASAWDENWRSSNHGADSPTDRQGYVPASHAPTLNTFYVALPFNDLAYPEEARRWLPEGWERRPGKDGKPVSACKDRWVEIKNEQGDVCYAQWEDVGPLTSDHPQYVFGDERPDTYTRAGLDVSPAVAKYLGIEPEGKNRLTSWRFVDAQDVPVGSWLVLGEEAVLFRGIHNLNNRQPSELDDDRSLQRSSAPIDDPSEIDANRKTVGASKG